MSEEKLYIVKNDDWKLSNVFSSTTNSKEQAELVAYEMGGHVVTLIEEPEKVVLSEKQAKIVDNAHGFYRPATFIYNESCSDDEEELMINAYVNGYTVAKEKKYNVKVPHTDDSYFYKVDGEYCNAGDSYHLEGMTDKKWFTDAEIEHYGLQDCERVKINMEDSNGN